MSRGAGVSGGEVVRIRLEGDGPAVPGDLGDERARALRGTAQPARAAHQRRRAHDHVAHEEVQQQVVVDRREGVVLGLEGDEAAVVRDRRRGAGGRRAIGAVLPRDQDRRVGDGVAQEHVRDRLVVDGREVVGVRVERHVAPVGRDAREERAVVAARAGRAVGAADQGRGPCRHVAKVGVDDHVLIGVRQVGREGGEGDEPAVVRDVRVERPTAGRGDAARRAETRSRSSSSARAGSASAPRRAAPSAAWAIQAIRGVSSEDRCRAYASPAGVRRATVGGGLAPSSAIG